MLRTVAAFGMVILPFFHIISSCRNETPVSSSLWSIPGEDSDFALLPGQGFNPIDGTVKGNCVLLGSLATQSGNVTGQTAEFRLLELSTESSLRENLNVSASASFSGIIGRGSARASFTKSVNKNNQSRYLLVHVRVANQLELASTFTYTQNAQHLLRKDSTREFLQHCGSEFVYGRRTGGEFFAVFELSFSSSEEDRAFSTAMAASGIGWQGSVNINSALESFGRFASTQIKIYKVGGNSSLPTFASIADFSRNFTSIVTDAGHGAVTLELVTKTYDGVEPVDLKPNTELLVRQRYVMEQLGKKRDLGQELMNSLHYIKSNLGLYELDQTSHLDPDEERLNIYLNCINEAAVACFENVFTGCVIPEMALPAIRLPQRKLKQQCRDIRVPICTLFNNKGECLAYRFEIRRNCR